MKSQAQKARQGQRKGGRYSKFPACNKCAKGIPFDSPYQQISDDPKLQAVCVSHGLPRVGIICGKCIGKIFPEY